MKVEYRKDLHHNYMVIDHSDITNTESYCLNLLEHHPVEGILRMERRVIDNQEAYYYDITAKQSVSNLYDKLLLTYPMVIRLFEGMIHTIDRAYDYLLMEDDFILKPDMVFMDVVSEAPYLCFLSGYQKDIKEQLSGFIEFIMNKVDYNDKEAVLLIYSLYAASREEGYTLDHLRDLIEKSRIDLGIPNVVQQVSHMEHKGDGNLKQGREAPMGGLPIGFGSEFDLMEQPVDYGHVTDKNTKSRMPLTKDNGFKSLDFKRKTEIPVMKEKIEGEEEVPCYPMVTYIYTGISILAGMIVIVVCVATKIIYNTYGAQINYSKLLALLLMLICIEAYVMKKIWDRKNRITIIVTKKEYVNPVKEFNDRDRLFHTNANKESITVSEDRRIALEANDDRKINQPTAYKSHELFKGKKEDTDNFSDTFHRDNGNSELEDYQPTCLLNGKDISCKVILKPLEEAKYEPITISEFPFFIGKLKKNVDYCLEKDVVSRYHAKIMKEKEQYYIIDLNSTNGTFLNNEPVPTYDRKEMKSGDEIAFANIKYRFLLQEE